MDLTGRYALPAPSDAVRGALNGAEILQVCAAGREAAEIAKLARLKANGAAHALL